MISSKLRIVSAIFVYLPGLPVNCSATKNGWLKNRRSIFRKADHDQLVFFAQFVNAKNRDDVLQVAIALQHRLNLVRTTW